MIPRNLLWTDRAQAITSVVTSINGKKLPAMFKLVEWCPFTKNADIGAGRYDNVTEFLREHQIQNVSFDPFNRPTDSNVSAISMMRDGQCDTVTVANTLNVIQERDDRALLIQRAHNVLRPGGIGFFQFHEGDKSGRGRISQVAKTGQALAWQENRKTRDYLVEIEPLFNIVSVKANLIIAARKEERLHARSLAATIFRSDLRL